MKQFLKNQIKYVTIRWYKAVILRRRNTQKLSKSNDFPSLPHGLQSRESEPKKPGSLAEKRK